MPNRRPMSAAVLSGLCILGMVAAHHAQAAFTVVDPKFISCSPKVLRPGQTLTLTLGPGHGAELAISRMAGEAHFFLVARDAGWEIPAGVTMSPEPFAKARTARISTDIFADYQTVRQKVFTRSGKYIVSVGDNLESDADPGYRCEFEFRR